MIQPALIKKQQLILCSLFVLIIITIAIGMGMGTASLSYDRLISTILGNGTIKEEFVLFSIRLPRIFITLLAGMALSLSGAILQGVTRNDLADPGMLGINAGAGVAITIFFLFFPIHSGAFAMILPLVAFVGALITACIIYLFSYHRGEGIQPARMVLVSVGCSTALSGLMIVLISSSERTKVDFIAKWLSGSIWGADWPFILAILPWLMILIPFTLYKANQLNILGLSEPMAIGVGISLERERIQLLLTSVALAASAVSVTGGISFIGLIAPHMAKAMIGPRNQLFIPIAVLIGGWFLLFADTVGRHMVEPNGIPAGIMVALIGAPYFLYLLVKKS
ncbi:MAG: iron transporter permease [Anaerosolibacter sp.]|jgi:iron complex transport system permease protein|uniref:FecCD family ABC transporter permease n=1 Tax=Anaerosolibacter sp. TaxID=1872527 RepID=UPI00262A12D7|nr:iron ABC transporter permease [Anaerosolibacter sp.]MDF2545154.1 iron transporter permease [Anaerosolibacter sp.]